MSVQGSRVAGPLTASVDPFSLSATWVTSVAVPLDRQLDPAIVANQYLVRA